ncbi:MAG TPA: hypothetical protein VML19_00495 [Verrucomicrobiae bacterium]|nr:hypothetical protein [Verrucomicrobiae bacterium]
MILQELSPYARVSTAVVPFVTAILLRLIFGKNKLTRLLLSVSTTWFAINVLMAPYSTGMQEDLSNLRSMFH